jgi:hypothetical protein
MKKTLHRRPWVLWVGRVNLLVGSRVAVRRRLAAVALCVFALVATACHVQVTPVGSAYSYTADGPGNVSVYSNTDSGNNNREIMWDGTGPDESDTTACFTVNGDVWPDQVGAVVHVRSGGVYFESVTQNIYGTTSAIENMFNLHTWDMGKFTLIGQVTIPGWPSPSPTSWSMCVKATATLLEFVVWVPGMAQPPWGSTTWGGEAPLPAGAPTSGESGFYEGHLVQNNAVTFSNAAVDGRLANPLTS